MKVFAREFTVSIADLLCDAVEIKLRCTWRDGRFQAAHEPDDVVLSVQKSRPPWLKDLHVARHIGSRREVQIEIRREDTNQDFIARIVQLLSDAIYIGGKAPLEKRIGDDSC